MHWIKQDVAVNLSVMEISLNGKTIVIIGGTTGLGLAAGKVCVSSGANVVVVGRNSERAEEAVGMLGEKARAYVGDATDSQTAVKAIEMGVNQFGGFDGLYHVAGGSGRSQGDGPLHELTDEGLEYALDLNLKSVVYSNRAAVREFIKQGAGGSVVNMASVLGFSPAPQYFSTHGYAAAKAAIIGYTKSVASYYAKQQIRFNVIAPALVATPMSERAQTDDQIQKYIATKQPLDGGRIGCPEDADAAVVYLLSDASRFMTGQTLVVDGGWSVSEGQY